MKLFLVFISGICIWNVISAQSIDLHQDSIVFEIKTPDFCLKMPNTDSFVLNNEIVPAAEELPEVLIYKNNEINAVALGIIPHEIKKLTLNEKRVVAAGTFKPIDLLKIIGGGMPLDPVINAITGRTKKLKKIVAVECKAMNVDFLKENYFSYISENFRLSETDFGRFLYFIADDPECTEVITAENKNLTEFFIAENWIKFNAENHH
jgi:hypothetical protein